MVSLVIHHCPIHSTPPLLRFLFFGISLTTLCSASNDILRIYDVAQSETSRHRTVPFNIVPGHRGGVISSIYLDPTCRFMLSSAGNRGWEGGGTEVLLGYEIGVQDGNGTWHK
jgi:transcriptional activator SPT8